MDKSEYNKKIISSRKWLLLPIETKAREFHAKVLFACFAAQRGWGVIIGPRHVIRKEQAFLPKGIIIEKSVTPLDENHISESLQNGNFVTGWDEEGLVYFNKDDYFERRISKKALLKLDKFFCWGEKQYNDLISDPDIEKDKLLITGNPRFDLLRKEIRGFYQNDLFKKRYGNYILINTKFGAIIPNDSYSRKYYSYIDYMKASGRCRSVRQELLLKKHIELQKQTLDYYLKLIPELSKRFTFHKIIIRPHPSENDNFWKKQTKSLSNVAVIYKGNANEWIFSADAMIHSNCTTGIEAYLMDRPSISYLPVRDHSVEACLANDLSVRAESIEEVIDILEKIINGNLTINKTTTQRKIVACHVAGINGDFASKRIIDYIEGYLHVAAESFIFSRPLSYCLWSYLQNIKKFFKPINKRFNNISKKELSHTITLLEAKTKLFDSIKYKQIKNDTFVICKDY